MEKIIVIENSIVKTDITILRDKNTSGEQFRLALERIGFCLALEIAKKIDLTEIDVETPLEKTKGFKYSENVVFVPILRAGLSLVDSFLRMYPAAKVGHIGIQRNEETLEPIDYYFKVPKNLNKSLTIVLDPMLATGGSASAAIKYLKAKDAKHIILATIIAAPTGIEKIKNDHPDVVVYTATLDRGLNEKGYIVPGLGDAGDRYFGTF